ncbi:hypothetical protein BDD12DRAFT_818773 [Trichophaea hybrida]|nr:hypothetical protein BDD12DRAFT_818773 [Trichophaea hybrida]
MSIIRDEMLIPPSYRRKRYFENDRCIEVSDGSSVIELPPHMPRADPIIIHQNRYHNQRPTEIIRKREVIMDPGSGSGVGRQRYRLDELDVVQYSPRRGRAKSLGGYTDSSYDTDSYYLEDGSRHGHSRQHQRPNNHTGRHLGEAALGGAVLGGALAHQLHRRRRRRSSSTSSGSSNGHSPHHHRIRHLAEAGIAVAGTKALYDHHRAQRGGGVNNHDNDPHHRARHLAEAGLGIAAAGTAKELFDHRRRTRSRSSDSSRSRSRSRSRSQSHPGRHIAAAALGATAAGMAAHKLSHRRRDSFSSYSSDDDDHQHHRGREVAAGLAGATAAGLAVKHYDDRRHNSRSSSVSSTTSHKSHKLRNTALGLGAAGLAAHHHHKKEQERRSRSRSQSRPGILRHRSRSQSAPRYQSHSHSRGPELAKVAAATMAGALAQRHHDREKRSRSLDVSERRRRHHELGQKKAHYYNDSRDYGRSIHPDSSVSNRPRSRRGSMGGVGNMIKNVIMPDEHHVQNGREEQHRSRKESMAMSIGHGIAAEVAYRVGEGLRHR